CVLIRAYCAYAFEGLRALPLSNALETLPGVRGGYVNGSRVASVNDLDGVESSGFTPSYEDEEEDDGSSGFSSGDGIIIDEDGLEPVDNEVSLVLFLTCDVCQVYPGRMFFLKKNLYYLDSVEMPDTKRKPTQSPSEAEAPHPPPTPPTMMAEGQLSRYSEGVQIPCCLSDYSLPSVRHLHPVCLCE
uniref:Uncharacterized protein n=1 Tax=Callorhinchus milii TaxID=7868 RepID=A0A4W3GF82_CALMI